MKRRRFFQTAALAIPAGSALLAQQPVTSTSPTPSPQPAPTPAASGMEYPKIETAAADQTAAPVLHFFSPTQYAALQRLSDLLMPSGGRITGALDAQVPEFLDFLIGKSPAARQKIYSTGLDALNKQAMLKNKKPFAELNDADAAAIIAPAIKPWDYVASNDPLIHFLEVARHDVRMGTLNSREYAKASDAGGGRRRGGMGMYWYPLD